MSQWFYSRQGQTAGPVSFEQLRALAAQRQLLPEDLVWLEAAKKWAPAKLVPNLFGAAAAVGQAVTATPGRVTEPATSPPNQAIAAAPRPAALAAGPAPAAATLSPVAEAAEARAGTGGGLSQALRGLPKPILFGLFGAIGGLLGALVLGELLWLLLAPGAHKVEPPPPLQMAVPNVPLTVYAGGKNRFQVKIARHGFDGPVSLAAVEKMIPEGVTVPQVTLSAGQTEAEVEVDVHPSLKPGKHQLAFKAIGPKADGAPEADGTLELKIVESPPFLGISVTPEVQVFQGGKAQFKIKANRNHFAGPVQFTFAGAPDHIRLLPLDIKDGRDEADVELAADRGAAVTATPTEITVKGVATTTEGKALSSDTKFKLEVKEAPIPRVDVMFVLDLTASMDNAILGIKNGIKDFVGSLKDQKLDSRIAFIGYRDIEDDKEFPFVLKVNGDVFTTDYQSFSNLVGKQVAKGGGDPPESTLQAMKLASEQPFRQDATKVIILITDEEPKYHKLFPPANVDETTKLLKDARINQVHIVTTVKAFTNKVRPHMAYKPMIDAFQGVFFDITDAKNDAKAFTSLLPKLSEEISKITIANVPVPPSSASPPPPPPASASELPPVPPPPELKIKAVQSTQGFATEDIPRLIITSGVWTAAVAAVICLLLIAGQLFYMRKAWMNAPDFTKGCVGGLLAGLIGGALAQSLFLLTPGGTTWQFVGYTVAWGLLGALIGGGMALVVPNLKWFRGLEGGVAGGILGAIGFVSLSLLLGDIGGRLLGATILGFCIGVMIALAELVFRRYWLELVYSAREIRTVTLGAATVGIGGDERQASVFVQGAPALALRYKVEGDRVLVQDVVSGQVAEAPPGDRRRVGNVTVSVHSPASARTVGLALQLSSGKRLTLGEGMPLTAEDLPGLVPQGTDGMVALLSRRPNDPDTLLLRNRSKQSWTARTASGQQSTIEPGRALELSLNLLINFGSVQGKLVPAAAKGR